MFEPKTHKYGLVNQVGIFLIEVRSVKWLAFHVKQVPTFRVFAGKPSIVSTSPDNKTTTKKHTIRLKMAKRRGKQLLKRATTRGNAAQNRQDGVDTTEEDASESDGMFVLSYKQDLQKTWSLCCGKILFYAQNSRVYSLIIFCIALISGKTHGKQLFSFLKFLLCLTMIISPLPFFLNNDNQCHLKIRQRNNVVPSLYHNKIQRCLLEHPLKLKPLPKSQ